MTATPRRTQAERREGTIAAIVDAAVEALGEVGYARTTTTEIARRAGVSQGGLFRHFDSRLDVILAAADAVRARQFVDFRAGLGALTEFDVAAVVRLLRRATRAPVNAAWYELLVAARTDPDLRARLSLLADRYHREIIEMGRALPIAAEMPSDELDTIVIGIVHMLDGEALTATVHVDTAREDLRVIQLVRILAGEPLFDRESGDGAQG
ncbi:TetR/AcrR family transcriptional regulator [Aeromicrobium chenweiae]|uniref:TetR/AcrR family transcriptional regulator n=1 Tax=Aeromicrobium chenweiae TaxID=2079793 RepID=A0A2S0WI28_9ACTN|nr:TetR/AcrR family transcriptional regulator [Aeromicrobium chenweiae]AWB90967.1 TetR/AcrR family transcriptional regulator [Aeromicrobium chenweiae]TGN32186.1 TetR/AcrR family transcriptional regulator [Aeromicrobium chenweiae]